MKIIVLGTRGFPDVQGGVEKHCEQLYPLLVDLGVDVTVLTRKPYVNAGQASYRGVTLIAIDCPRQKFFEAMVHSFRALFYARKLKPDLVHIHAIGPSFVVPLARLMGLKVVITHHGCDYKRQKWNVVARLVLRFGEAAGCLWTHQIITIASYLAQDIQKRFRRTAAVIPNGVDIFERVPPGEMLKRFGLVSGKYFLAVGRIVPEKGFHDLLDAYALSGVKGMPLVIVGDPDHEDLYSRSFVKKARQMPGVILTGFLSGQALREMYSHAGVFVLPSHYEGLPIVLLEAMSYGLSCLVSDIPANHEVDLPQDRYVSVGNIDVWAQKMRFWAGAPLMDQERVALIDHIRCHYDRVSSAKHTLRVYLKVLEKKQ